MASTVNPPVDSPFAKLLFSRGDQFIGLGIPAPFTEIDDPNKARLYAKCADILGFDSEDPRYIGFKIRHLDFCLRNSRYRDRISWRSGLEDLDKLAPIFDEPEGLVVVHTTTNNISASVVRSGAPSTKVLTWEARVYGVYPNLNATVNEVPATVADPDSFYILLGDSGYTLRCSVSAGSNDQVSLYAKVLIPYSENLVSIRNSIRGNKDILTQVVTDQEYLDVLLNSDSVEDGLAAFLLSVDAL